MEAGRESEEGVLHLAGEHGGWKARRERTLLGDDDDEDEEERVMTHSFMMICATARGDERRLERTKREAGGSRLSGETNVGSSCGWRLSCTRLAVRFENIAKWGKRASEPQLAEGEGIFAILYGVYDPFHLHFLSHILPEPCASVCDLC